jgi:hypothetical protein
LRAPHQKDGGRIIGHMAAEDDAPDPAEAAVQDHPGAVVVAAAVGALVRALNDNQRQTSSLTASIAGTST